MGGNDYPQAGKAAAEWDYMLATGCGDQAYTHAGIGFLWGWRWPACRQMGVTGSFPGCHPRQCTKGVYG